MLVRPRSIGDLQDLADGLYDSYYLNFIAPIPRDHLEDLATAALEANSQQSIAKVMHGCQTNRHNGARHVQIYDQYLDFITLEDELFYLRQVGRESVSNYGECVARERPIGVRKLLL